MGRSARTRITCQMAGADKATLMPSYEAAVEAVHAAYPDAYRQGAAGGWSWDIDGVVVAASNFVAAHPPGRHWLAIRPKGAPDA